MTVATETAQAKPTYTHLVSKEGGVTYDLQPLHVCEETFAPLEVAYDYEAIRAQVSRESIAAGPKSIWRYKPFLPVTGEVIDVGTGMTPLIKSKQIGRAHV